MTPIARRASYGCSSATRCGSAPHREVAARVDDDVGTGERHDDLEHPIDQAPLAERADVDDRRLAQAETPARPGEALLPVGGGRVSTVVDEPVGGVVAARLQRRADQRADRPRRRAVEGDVRVEHVGGVGRRCDGAGSLRERGHERIGSESRPLPVERRDQVRDRGAGFGAQRCRGLDLPRGADRVESPHRGGACTGRGGHEVRLGRRFGLDGVQRLVEAAAGERRPGDAAHRQ